MRERKVRIGVGYEEEGAGEKRVRHDQQLEEKGIRAGFPSTQGRRLHDYRVHVEANWLA